MTTTNKDEIFGKGWADFQPIFIFMGLLSANCGHIFGWKSFGPNDSKLIRKLTLI
jgi:hypothetical protein